MTNRDVQHVIDAIDRYRAMSDPPNVFFGDRIPRQTLNNALATFAQLAANEKALLLIPATASGKAGFLFTEQALYFGEALGSVPVRMPWDEITNVRREPGLLQIKSRKGGFKWDLTGTLLWERGRRDVANVVVDALEIVLRDEPESAGFERAVAFDVTEETAVDWPTVLWFHVPVVLLGGLIALPMLYLLIANADAFGEASNRLAAKGSDRALLGLLSIAPVVYAFGTSLRFSMGRFVAAVVLLGFLQITIAINSAVLDGATLPISLGGGFVGILLGYALGHSGLKMQALLRSASVQRLVWMAAIALVAGIGTLSVRDHLRQAQHDAESEARQQADTALRNDYWEALFVRLEAVDAGMNTVSKRSSLRGQTSLIWKLNEQAELSVSVWPCVELSFEGGDERLPYIDRLIADRENIEARLGPTLEWSEPIMRRVHAGAAVSERQVSSRPRYWDNGKVWNCLSSGKDRNAAYRDRADWPRQHEWIADQVAGFVGLLSARTERPPETPVPAARSAPRPRPELLENQSEDAATQLAAVEQRCAEISVAIAQAEALLMSREAKLSGNFEGTNEIQRSADFESLRAGRRDLEDLVSERTECEAERVRLEAYRLAIEAD